MIRSRFGRNQRRWHGLIQPRTRESDANPAPRTSSRVVPGTANGHRAVFSVRRRHQRIFLRFTPSYLTTVVIFPVPAVSMSPKSWMIRPPPWTMSSGKSGPVQSCGV